MPDDPVGPDRPTPADRARTDRSHLHRSASGRDGEPTGPGRGEPGGRLGGRHGDPGRPSLAGADQVDPAQKGSGEVTASVVVNAPAERVFAGFVAWERQGEWIPLTTVRVVSGEGGVGTTLEAVTRLGPGVLLDKMRIDRVDAPYEVRVVHYGQLLRGPGVMRCTPLAGNRTQMVWHEWFQLPAGLAGRVAWPVMWPGSKLSLTYALRRFARLVEAGVLP